MTPLHVFGNWLRELFGMIPPPVVRILFVAVPMVLLIWVLRLPREAVTPPNHPARWDENLKLWAAVALVIQIGIYLFL